MSDSIPPGKLPLAVRIGVALICAGLLVWLVVTQTKRLKDRAQQDLAQLPDDAIPKYECLEETITTRTTRTSPGLKDVTDDWNIRFDHVVGPLGTYFMPESIGAGAAVLDYDGDGRLDLYFVNCGQSPKALQPLPPDVRFENRMFRQLDDGTFRDVTQETGLGDTGYGAGVAVGDVDNDGWPDVFIANYGQDALYRNTGMGHFENITASLGSTENEWGTAAAFFDYDRDGWLDLFVVNYTADPTYGHSVACGFQHGLVSYCGPHKFLPTIDRLYHNETAAADNSAGTVRFRDVTQEAGLSTATTFGFGVICTDLTSDGWPDVMVANDGAANRLWVNQQNGTFLEEAQLRGIAVNGNGMAEAGMGVALGDVNFDTRPDILITHLSKETATLYLAVEGGVFVDQTPGSGIDSATRKHTGWGTALIDLDHDGLLDLPIVNGLVIPCHSGFPFHGEDHFQQQKTLISNDREYWKAYVDENKFLMGTENKQFRDSAGSGGDLTAAFASGRGLMYADLDADGDLDLIVTNCGSSARSYRNDLPKQGQWLKVRVRTGAGGRDALGARVTLDLADKRRTTGFCVPQTSYLCSNEAVVHFGLGSAETIDRIVVDWPDGPVADSVEEFPGATANQVLVLNRGSGKPIRSINE